MQQIPENFKICTFFLFLKYCAICKRYIFFKKFNELIYYIIHTQNFFIKSLGVSHHALQFYSSPALYMPPSLLHPPQKQNMQASKQKQEQRKRKKRKRPLTPNRMTKLYPKQQNFCFSFSSASSSLLYPSWCHWSLRCVIQYALLSHQLDWQ